MKNEKEFSDHSHSKNVTQLHKMQCFCVLWKQRDLALFHVPYHINFISSSPSEAALNCGTLQKLNKIEHTDFQL